MVWLQNDKLLGFLFISIFSLWASNGLFFVEDHLKPVLFLFSPLQQLFCESFLEARGIKALKKNTNGLAPK